MRVVIQDHPVGITKVTVIFDAEQYGLSHDLAAGKWVEFYRDVGKAVREALKKHRPPPRES